MWGASEPDNDQYLHAMRKRYKRWLNTNGQHLRKARSESAIDGYCKEMQGASEPDNHQYFSCYEEEVQEMPQHQWTAFEKD